MLYYRRGALFDAPTDTNVSKHPATREQIPYFYAHAQLLLDSKSRLIAYTLMGETTTVVTAVGIFRGSDLRVLDESTWIQLIAR